MDTNQQTVLVVDDESEIREFVRFVLEREGYVVHEAADGSEGMETVRRERINLLITDLVMPEKEGIETILNVRSILPDLKIIAMSGAINNDTYLKVAGSLGAHRTLKKPFNRQQLLDTVNDVTEKTTG